MAGLVCLYDTMNYMYLRVYFSQSLGGPALGLIVAENGRRQELLESRVNLTVPVVHLKVVARALRLQFSWSLDGENWNRIGPDFDETHLSDEYCTTGEFTGAFVGLTAQDLARREAWAWFDWFDYEGL